MLLAYFSLPFHQLLSKHVSSDHNASFHVTFSAMPTQLCQVAVFVPQFKFNVHRNDVTKQTVNKLSKYIADTVLHEDDGIILQGVKKST